MKLFEELKTDQAHFKMLAWGASGSGKTLWSLKDKNVAYISLEGGADRYASLGIQATYPNTLEDIGNVIRFLRNDQKYQTVVVDSISVVWDMVKEKFIHEDQKQPNWIVIKTTWKKLLGAFLRLQKNVILISRAKPETTVNFFERTGNLTVDCESTVSHEVDYVAYFYNVFNEENTEFLIRFDKVRDISGKVKTGMIFKNTSFGDFRERVEKHLQN